MSSYSRAMLRTLLTTVSVGSILFSVAGAQSTPSSKPSTAAPAVAKTRPKNVSYRPSELPASAKSFYQSRWGVDTLSAKAIDSGLLIRFNYRVVDVEKAKMLSDKKATPYLVDQKAGVKLVVPNLEKVGELRNKAIPEEGKVYWMVFSNKGNFVKPGHRVSVEIGKVRIDGLVVQ